MRGLFKSILFKSFSAVIVLAVVVSVAKPQIEEMLPKFKDKLPSTEIESIIAEGVELERATVKRVIDGDTIIVDTDKEKDMRIRFIGVDTPESVHPDENKNTVEGIKASEYTQKLIPEGTELFLERDKSNKDQYDRYLRYIWLTGDVDANPDLEFVRDNMVNGILLSNGVADIATFEPDTKYVDIFKKLSR